ncbi:MAG: TonB family protein [Endomicrobium sp.]|nr:TonB family protein [Endomicrobium sp.]
MLDNGNKKKSVCLSVPVEVFFNSPLHKKADQSIAPVSKSSNVQTKQQETDQPMVSSVSDGNSVQTKLSPDERKKTKPVIKDSFVKKKDSPKKGTNKTKIDNKVAEKLKNQTTNRQPVKKGRENVVSKSLPSDNDSNVETFQSPDSPAVSVSYGSQYGEVSFDTKNFKFSYYGNQIGKKIISQSRWVESYGKFRVLVYFKIHKSGTISDVFIKESSGNKEYDKNALDAIYRAVPLPELPESYEEDFLGVFFEFK